MDKSHHEVIEKLIQQNPVISGFDIYYLGFFSYHVTKLSLEEIFTHMRNIINLHNEDLITNEVKIDLLIKMLIKKIDLGLLNLVSVGDGEDIENRTKNVLNEYFSQIMKIIPKFTSISKFELFYIGRFHAIYPSYKISELFQHINNINVLVHEDLIDEDTQIDFLLKILNKKLQSNKSGSQVLNIPKDSDKFEPYIKEEHNPQVKQEAIAEQKVQKQLVESPKEDIQQQTNPSVHLNTVIKPIKESEKNQNISLGQSQQEQSKEKAQEERLDNQRFQINKPNLEGEKLDSENNLREESEVKNIIKRQESNVQSEKSFKRLNKQNTNEDSEILEETPESNRTVFPNKTDDKISRHNTNLTEYTEENGQEHKNADDEDSVDLVPTQGREIRKGSDEDAHIESEKDFDEKGVQLNKDLGTLQDNIHSETDDLGGNDEERIEEEVMTEENKKEIINKRDSFDSEDLGRSNGENKKQFNRENSEKDEYEQTNHLKEKTSMEIEEPKETSVFNFGVPEHSQSKEEIVSKKPSTSRQNSQQETKNLLSKMYPKKEEHQKLGTLDEILHGLLSDEDNEQENDRLQNTQNHQLIRKATSEISHDNFNKNNLPESQNKTPSEASQEMQLENKNRRNMPKDQQFHKFENTMADDAMEIEYKKDNTNEQNNKRIPFQSQQSGRSLGYQRSSSDISASGKPHIMESQASVPDQSYILRWRQNQPDSMENNQFQKEAEDLNFASLLENPEPESKDSSQEIKTEANAPKQFSTQLRNLLDAPTLADDGVEEEAFDAPVPRSTMSQIEEPKQEIKLEQILSTIADESASQVITVPMRGALNKINEAQNSQISESKTNQIEQQARREEAQKINREILKTEEEEQRRKVSKQQIEASSNQQQKNRANISAPSIHIQKPIEEEITQQQRKPQNQTSVNFNQCAICKDDFVTGNSVKDFELCKHRFHRGCLTEYLEDKIDSKFPSLECPAPNCGKKFRLADLLEFLDQDYLEDYVILTLKLYVDKSDKVACCPTSDCSYAFFKGNQTKFQCPVCKKFYCLRCHMDWHEGIDCEYYERKRRAINSEDSGSKFKKCSKCGEWVAKKPGNNVLHCKCGYNSCYTCGKERNEKNCECQKSSRFRPVVHPDVFHQAMQTPDTFINYKEGKSSRNNTKTNQSSHYYKPVVDQKPTNTRNTVNQKDRKIEEEDDGDISYDGDNDRAKKVENDDEDDDISYKASPTRKVQKPDIDDDLSYQESSVNKENKFTVDDDLSYQGNDDKPKKTDDDDDISFNEDVPRGGANNKADKKLEDDISYDEDKNKDLEDDISYKGSPKKGDVDSDISA